MFDVRYVRNFYLLCCLAVLAACSNGRGSVDSEQPPPSPPAQSGFTVSGTVAGLDGDGLVVQLNAGNDLAVPNNGTFTFTTQLANAAAYNVTVPRSRPARRRRARSATPTARSRRRMSRTSRLPARQAHSRCAAR